MKCNKCQSPVTETYQRGPSITGTRCLSCGYETLAKVIKTVSELRAFLEKVYEDRPIVFGDSAPLRLEAHFIGDMEKTEKVKVWSAE